MFRVFPDCQLFYCLVILAYKCAGDGIIYVINLVSLLWRQQKQAALVCGFQWTHTDTQYVNLGAASGNYSR